MVFEVKLIDLKEKQNKPKQNPFEYSQVMELKRRDMYVTVLGWAEGCGGECCTVSNMGELKEMEIDFTIFLVTRSLQIQGNALASGSTENPLHFPTQPLRVGEILSLLEAVHVAL